MLPEVGFAMDFPAEWQVRGSSTPLLGEAIREVLEASTDDANCRVVDASRLFAGHGEDGLASMHEPRLEARSQGEWRLLDSGYLDLPVGRVGQVVYENRHGPAEQTYADYSLTDGDTSVTLQCVGDKRPEDDWLSIVKTFEFLPAEE